ncbi:glycoside hydrolase superfamily [Aspergillus unguis]
MTDRFARTDGSTTHPCNLEEKLYCGGTWKGTMSHLDYIQGMGFDAVLISPINRNIEERTVYGEGYHGYWIEDLYSLNLHFGTHDDLLELSQALHNRGMFLMLDVVINNMAYPLNGSNPTTDIDYSAFNPFNEQSFYHPYCRIDDWNDYAQSQYCWTGDTNVALPDLNTEDERVQAILEMWIQQMISTYEIDGLRIDAAKHITPDFLRKFEATADIFMFGEVYERTVDIICGYQSNIMNSVTNYPIYFALLDAFTLGNINSLPDKVETMKNSCPSVTTLTIFTENHDNDRFASMNNDMTLAKNIITFTLLFDGLPIIYQGQEQHFSGTGDPYNREPIWPSAYNTSSPLYTVIRTLNAIRKHATRLDPDNYPHYNTFPVFRGWYEMGFRKGRDGQQIVMVLSTKGSHGDAYTITMADAFQSSIVVRDVLSCRTWTVNDKGELWLDMDKGEPRVLFPEAAMRGSGLCGFGRNEGRNLDFIERFYAPGSGDEVSEGSISLNMGLRWTWFLCGLLGLIS